ncbi:ESX secretion-associated protein EspG [Pseudonocardia bannensis]|uniref:ESX secretion-associated protein EspG n=1 Tax=Pseudonocardia bannensis TaxID=630973 RepID=A0A848DP66_9PSEU|nr:ESX secretion-associated protein EspG [Pseudonocardia bannensis]NMH94630.1 ESX secretion-associated protein EspG [Pseudonocardia bannensis]
MRESLFPAATAGPTHRRVLTAVEFDVLWERLGLGPTPVVLRLASPGRTHGERAQIVAAGLQALRRRGLTDASGPDPELARLLTVLARPARQLELRAWLGRSVRAVAAGDLDLAVLAVRQDSTVTLETCGSLPAGVLGVLPTAVPGPGRASTVPTQVLAEALAHPGDLRQALIARAVPAADATLLARMLHDGGRRSQLTALVTDRWEVPRRLSRVLTVLDGPRGRHLLTRSTADDGTDWTTIGPTDERRLRHRVDELLSEAATAAEQAA